MYGIDFLKANKLVVPPELNIVLLFVDILPEGMSLAIPISNKAFDFIASEMSDDPPEVPFCHRFLFNFLKKTNMSIEKIEIVEMNQESGPLGALVYIKQKNRFLFFRKKTMIFGVEAGDAVVLAMKTSLDSKKECPVFIKREIADKAMERRNAEINLQKGIVGVDKNSPEEIRHLLENMDSTKMTKQ